MVKKSKFKISKSNLICIALSVLISVSLFSGCSSDSDNYSRSSNNEKGYNTAAPAENMGGGFSNEMAEQDGISFDKAIESAPTSTTQYEKKLIKNANLTMESLDVEKAYAELLEFISQKGGYEFSREMSVKNEETSVYATFKVPPTELDEILKSASNFAEVLSSNVLSDDISEGYYDYKVRLENKRKNLEKYYEFLESARTVEDMITLQNQIDNITAEIESYEGRIRMWDSLVDESTISVRIIQKDNPDEIVEEEVEWDTLTFSKVGRMMKNGFTRTCNVIFSIVQWILVILVSILPIIVIVAIVITILLVRKSKKKKKAELSNQKNIESNKNE